MLIKDQTDLSSRSKIGRDEPQIGFSEAIRHPYHPSGHQLSNLSVKAQTMKAGLVGPSTKKFRVLANFKQKELVK